MALTSYSELQTAVASFLHRTDLTSEILDFIRLAEADLQVRAKLSQWDTTAVIPLTSGVGSAPGDLAHIQSVTYGAGGYTVDFRPHVAFDTYAASGEAGSGPEYYTIRGSSILVYPLYTGDITVAYTARFTPLSNSATTNSLLLLFPDAYLHGTLAHACSWSRDAEGSALYGGLFDNDISRVRKYMYDFKFPDGLQMRAA